jgi:hypothetical protein
MKRSHLSYTLMTFGAISLSRSFPLSRPSPMESPSTGKSLFVGDYELGRSLGSGNFSQYALISPTLPPNTAGADLPQHRHCSAMLPSNAEYGTPFTPRLARRSPSKSWTRPRSNRWRWRRTSSTRCGPAPCAHRLTCHVCESLINAIVFALLQISVMSAIKHQNIVNMIEVMASKTKIFLVLELVTGGELFERIGASHTSLISNRITLFICSNHHSRFAPQHNRVDSTRRLRASTLGSSSLVSVSATRPAYVIEISRCVYDPLAPLPHLFLSVSLVTSRPLYVHSSAAGKSPPRLGGQPAHF